MEELEPTYPGLLGAMEEVEAYPGDNWGLPLLQASGAHSASRALSSPQGHTFPVLTPQGHFLSSWGLAMTRVTERLIVTVFKGMLH
jgi:hypothetical protein